MMDAFRRWCEKILRIPPEPEPPPGDEASARTFRAAPAYLRLLLIVWGISNVAIVFFVTMSMGIGLVVALVETRQQPGAGLIAAFLALVLLMIVVALVFQAVFRYAVIRLEYEKRWYVVTDRSLRIREGVVTVSEMTVTFANIQNVSTSQGPIQRLLGLADLQVETAGGGGSGSFKNSLTAFFPRVRRLA